MNLEGILNAYLSAYPGLVALVGDRVYSVEAQEDVAAPYCVHFPTSDIPDHHLAGPSGLREVYEQVSCFAETGAAAGAIAAQVDAAIKAWAASETSVGPVRRINRFLLKEPDVGLIHVVLEYVIHVQKE